MDLVSRLKLYMDKNGIAISQFADTCGIPRPTMSQLLSGRNKKVSDELISKIHNAYPALSVLWLMFGEGEMEADSNTRFSEAQNGPSEGYFNSESPNNDPVSDDAGQQNPYSKNESEKFSGDGGLFSFSENEPDSTTRADQANDPQRFYVSTHEIIEFDDDRLPENGTSPSGQINYPKTSAASQTPPSTPASASASPSAMTAEAAKEIQAKEAAAKKNEQNSISLPTLPNKTITNIVVFYSDNSFQSFSPSKI